MVKRDEICKNVPVFSEIIFFEKFEKFEKFEISKLVKCFRR